MRKMFRSVLVVMLVAVLMCSSALAASYGAKVLSSSMPVYGYSDGSKVQLGTLSQGTRFKVTAMSGDWAKINYNGSTCYAKLKDIIFNSRIKAVATRDTSIKFVTRESYANNTYYKATLAAGSVVYVAGFKGSSYLVTNADSSAIGYVSASALTKG